MPPTADATPTPLLRRAAALVAAPLAIALLTGATQHEERFTTSDQPIGVTGETIPGDPAARGPQDVPAPASRLDVVAVASSETAPAGFAASCRITAPPATTGSPTTLAHTAELTVRSGATGTQLRSFTFGGPTDDLLVGDWTGAGKAGIGARRANIFFLRDTATTGDPDRIAAYGRATDDVYMGDWDGNGTVTPAVRRGNIFHFVNEFRGGEADIVIAYGKPDDEVLIGDWNGDGRDTPAVRRGNIFYFVDEFRGGEADTVIAYGKPEDRVLIGDWDGDTRQTPTVRRGNLYYVTNAFAGGEASSIFTFASPASTVVAGDIDGDRRDDLVAR